MAAWSLPCSTSHAVRVSFTWTSFSHYLDGWKIQKCCKQIIQSACLHVNILVQAYLRGFGSLSAAPWLANFLLVRNFCVTQVCNPNLLWFCDYSRSPLSPHLWNCYWNLDGIIKNKIKTPNNNKKPQPKQQQQKKPYQPPNKQKPPVVSFRGCFSSHCKGQDSQEPPSKLWVKCIKQEIEQEVKTLQK